jgi:hypothetical protein
MLQAGVDLEFIMRVTQLKAKDLTDLAEDE